VAGPRHTGVREQTTADGDYLPTGRLPDPRLVHDRAPEERGSDAGDEVSGDLPRLADDVQRHVGDVHLAHHRLGAGDRAVRHRVMPAGVEDQRQRADDGWIFLPDLWVTHDGGAHWTRQSVGQVLALEAASGTVHAAVLAADQPQFAVLTSPVHGDAWQPSATKVDAGAGPVPRAQLVLHGTAGWLMIVNRTVAGGARLAGGRWIGWQPPCMDGRGAVELAASSASDLVAVCNEGEWNDRPHVARAYMSHDGGSSFGLVPTPLPIQGAGGLGASGAPTPTPERSSSAPPTAAAPGGPCTETPKGGGWTSASPARNRVWPSARERPDAY